jgi:hypothetical protein
MIRIIYILLAQEINSYVIYKVCSVTVSYYIFYQSSSQLEEKINRIILPLCNNTTSSVMCSYIIIPIIFLDIRDYNQEINGRSNKRLYIIIFLNRFEYFKSRNIVILSTCSIAL